MRHDFLPRCAFAAAAITLAAGSAVAQPLLEAEPNNTFAAANFIAAASYPTGAVAIDGVIAPDGTPAGVDFFSFSLTAGDFVAVSIFDNTPGIPDDNDPFLGIFDPTGLLFASNDDDGPGLLPSFNFQVPTSGTWAFAVTGFGDDGFVGSHNENFSYKLVFAINPVPAPSAAALLGLGALAATRRRR